MNYPRHHVSCPTLQLDQRSEQRALTVGKVRLYAIAAFFGLCFVSLSVRLVNITLHEQSLMQLVQESINGVSNVRDDAVAGVALFRGKLVPDESEWLPAVPDVVMPRQTIRDRNNVILASSVATRSVYAKPKEIDNPQAVLAHISKILPDMDINQLMRRLNSSAKFVWIKRHITPKEQEALLWSGIPGIYLHDDYQRIYPQGRLFSHVLGYTDVDGAGISGVEKYFNDSLSRDDTLKPLTLSLDVRLQQGLLNIVEAQMQKHQAIGATGAIFHIPTGSARAMVSLPDYNPNMPMASTENARFNRLSVGQYELGSVFKTFSAALAFEHGGVTMTQGFDATNPILIGGMRINDYHAKKRWMTVPEIFAYSSNIGTVKMMQSAGTKKQREFLDDLGLFSNTGLEINERSTPFTNEQWRPLQSATISYGHGISVTPLHLLKGLLAMTGGGEARELTLLKDTKKPATRVMHKETSKALNRLLRAVVQHGTASKADVAGYAVGGKTGTAEKAVAGGYSANKKISSMVAAFPMPNPEYVLFVMLDEPQGTKDTFNFATAGWVAAPAIGDIVRYMVPIVGIAPQYDEPVDEVDQLIVNAEARAEAARRSRFVQQVSY